MQGHVCKGQLIASRLSSSHILDAKHAGVQRAMDQGSFVQPQLTDDRERHREDTTNDHFKLAGLQVTLHVCHKTQASPTNWERKKSHVLHSG